jgi:murein DD-endopeptidase MepM/ murein hydrolase activator NlpD
MFPQMNIVHITLWPTTQSMSGLMISMRRHGSLTSMPATIPTTKPAAIHAAKPATTQITTPATTHITPPATQPAATSAAASPHSSSAITVRELPAIFGIRSLQQVGRDVGHMIRRRHSGFQFGLSTLGFFRPDIGVPTYLGKRPKHRLAPIFHCFDRIGGGQHYSQRVTRQTMTDFRGKHLGYDEHDGIDFACPIGTELTAAAPGHVVMIRDNWLRGGLTIAIDHGHGLLTQYTHCWQPRVVLGQAVARGQTVALSGSAGVDMTISFPWVSPHIHFMVWHRGRPVDPFLAEGEADHTGTWLVTNTPGHQPVQSEPLPELSAVDDKAVQQMIAACRDTALQQALLELAPHISWQAAFLEDALHHDRHAWEDTPDPGTLRPVQEGSMKLSLPLTQQHYDGAFFADEPILSPGFWV